MEILIYVNRSLFNNYKKVSNVNKKKIIKDFYLLILIFVGHAKDALEISKLQETTRQQEQMAKIKEYEAAIEQAKVEQKRVDYEERRKTLQVQKIYIKLIPLANSNNLLKFINNFVCRKKQSNTK